MQKLLQCNADQCNVGQCNAVTNTMKVYYIVHGGQESWDD